MSNELTLPTEPKLSIFQIESELSELMEFRGELVDAGESVEAVDSQIAEYVSRELTKVDNLRAYLRHCEVKAAQARAAADIAKEEVSQQLKRAGSWETRLDYLKGCCLSAMSILGKKRLEGRTGYLLAKTNGGKQALTIYDESLVPDGLCNYVGSISGDVFERLLAEGHWLLAYHNTDATIWTKGVSFSRSPNNEAIRKSLDAACERCGGNGLMQDGSDLPCGNCGGTGKQVVPGARLEPRGSHIEVK